MRHEKTVAILALARELAASAEGLTLDEMANIVNASRRSAERMRDAVEAAFGPLDRIEDGRRTRFRLAARGLGNFAAAPTAEELTELENAARALEAAGNVGRAVSLRTLRQKIGASLREADRRRLAVDVEAQLRAEALACTVGPRPLADPAVLATLREALLAGVAITFGYGDPPRWRKVVPYGLLFGPRAYLVARVAHRDDPVLFRLDTIHDVKALDEPGAPPPDFDLKTYAEQSFGVFHEEPEDIVLCFAPSAAPDARAFLFHPTQRLSDEPDGSLTVRFRAGGFLEMAHHLMTWGPDVTIVAPQRLKDPMREKSRRSMPHYGPGRRREALGRAASPVDRLESPPVQAVFDKVVLVKDPDHQVQRLLEVGARGACFVRVEDGRRQDVGHDARFAIVRELPVSEPRLPRHELAFGEGVVLVEPLGELLQRPLAGLGGILGSRPVRQTERREVSFGSVRAHVASASFARSAVGIAWCHDRIGRSSSDVRELGFTKVGMPTPEFWRSPEPVSRASMAA